MFTGMFQNVSLYSSSLLIDKAIANTVLLRRVFA